PVLSAVLRGKYMDETISLDVDGEEHIVHYHKLFFDPLDQSRFLAFALIAPKYTLLQDAYKAQRYSLVLIVTLIIASVMCAGFFANILRQPLHQIIREIRAYGKVRGPLILPVERKDEIGELA